VISDTGIGITKDRADRLFQPFFQVDSSMSRKYGGTGLGLAISKTLVQMMGGHIGVESEEGKGSKFWFTATFEKQPNHTTIWCPADAQIQEQHILVVAGGATDRLVLCERLRSWGCRHEGVCTGEEALDMLRKAREVGDPFSAAIIDTDMSGRDAETLGREIKKTQELRDTVLVMLTSLSEQTDPTRLQKSGFAACLTKPVKASSLYDCLVAVSRPSPVLPEAGPPAPIVSRDSCADSIERQVKILVAEDNPVSQRVAVRLLEKLGYHADVVSNGREAVSALEVVPYDVVLMDVQMPDMDGFEATAIFRQNEKHTGRHIPIIAMTAHATKGDRDRCIEAGMDDYISKPVCSKELAEVLKRTLSASANALRR
jgi:CheY-like chemotaxis protein